MHNIVLTLILQDKWSTASVERFRELCANVEVLQMTVVRTEGTVVMGVLFQYAHQNY